MRCTRPAAASRFQILHAGRYARHKDLVGASDLPAPINRMTPHVLTEAEVEQTIDDFAACAARTRSAGYSGRRRAVRGAGIRARTLR